MANKTVNKLRDVFVVFTVVLMIAVVVFQWLEITKFQLQDVIGSRLKAFFASEQVAAPSAPAQAAPQGPGAPQDLGTPGAPGMDAAPGA